MLGSFSLCFGHSGLKPTVSRGGEGDELFTCMEEVCMCALCNVFMFNKMLKEPDQFFFVEVFSLCTRARQFLRTRYRL